MAQLFDSVTLSALLDKIIVAGLVYGCTLFLRKEVALRLLAILSALVIAEFGASQLGLSATASLFHLLLSSAPEQGLLRILQNTY